nr:unnamed protein product [Spirometra erinaceieuropaei]
MVRQLPDGMMERVTDNRNVSKALAGVNDVKQICVLVLPSSASCPKISIVYRTGGRLNNRCSQAPMRLSTAVVHYLFFADDWLLNSATEADMRRDMDLYVSGYANLGMTINTGKTGVIYQPPPNAAHSVSRIHVNDTQLKTEGRFICLGSALSHFIKIDEETADHISRAGYSLDQLQTQHIFATVFRAT